MSEAERLRRQQYKKNRKKWITVQLIALALLVAIALASFLVYDKMNSTYYIEYNDKGSVDYKVYLKDNTFFDDDYVGSGNSYVARLIDKFNADFAYTLNMGAKAGFTYTYEIGATVNVTNRDSGDIVYAPSSVILPKTTAVARNKSQIAINENVDIDYHKYNAIATNFVNAYGLNRVTSTLIVTMTVDVISSSEKFDGDSRSSYFVSLNIPLMEENFSVYSTSTPPATAGKVLAAVGGVNQIIFRVAGDASSLLFVILLIFFVVFVYITRNEDINYTNKVKKIVSSYRSFIQQIHGQFDTEGYQLVEVKTFREMLAIRDTIQSPVLMFENLDQTMTEFVIPTNTKILYSYVIKVDNYDAIYGIYEEEKGTVMEFACGDSFEEAVIVDNNANIEEIAEAMATPDVELNEIDYVPDTDEDFDGTPEDPGVEVVGVVWPERAHRNKVYRYDPDGEKLEEGDMVLVKTRDAARDREVIRKAAIAHANHKIDPALHPHPLKKIIAIIKRRAEMVLAPESDKEEAKK